jgi:7-keto-8-aminopelargonate synthetase-like enzyme
MDDFLAGILGAGAGGVGGYALGKKFLDPMLGRKAQQAEEVARRLRKGQALAPLGAAALGALVLAAIAAANARKNERAKMEKEFFLRQQIKDSPVLSRYGITANEILPVNRGFY